MSRKPTIWVKKLERKLKFPYALGPSPRGIIACVTRLMASPTRLADSLAAYRFLRESSFFKFRLILYQILLTMLRARFLLCEHIYSQIPSLLPALYTVWEEPNFYRLYYTPILQFSFPKIIIVFSINRSIN
jgi:hypothetical protein